MRLITVIVIGTLLASAPSGAEAAKNPRVPPGNWAVEYAKDYCILSRDGVGGAPGIAFRTRPFSDEHDLLIYVPRTSEKETSVRGQLRIDGELQGADRWISIGEPLRERKLIDTRVSTDEMAKISGANSIRLSSVERLDVTVPLPIIAKATAALRACEIELASRWGVMPEEMARFAKPARSETDLRSMFWSKDARSVAILRNPVRAVLDIDAVGAVINCQIVQSSRVAWVDARFCETLRAKARFRPASDAGGKPVRGKFATPAITSALIRR